MNTLEKTKFYLSLRDKLITKDRKDLVDDSWIDRLWEWADEKGISDLEWRCEDWRGLPRDKVKLLNLTELDLSYNQLTELPKEIGNLFNLTELYLNGNELTELPKEIENLINLTEINVSGDRGGSNPIKELPKEIGNLTNLKKIILGYKEGCSIYKVELSKEIAKLINLRKLDLSCCGLTELPKEIANLTNLTYLNLEINSNLILTKEQKEWIENLQLQNCKVYIDDDLLDRTFFNGRIKNCYFSYKCPLEWDNLNFTDDTDIKYCEECKKNVYRVYSEEEFHEMADNQRCVYIKSTEFETLGYPSIVYNHSKIEIDDDEIPF